MKLCYIANPNSVHTRRWLNWFASRGHKVSLIADTPLLEPWPAIQVYDLPARLNLKIVRFFPWTVWSKQILQELEPDVLHAHRVNSAGWLSVFTGFHPMVVTPWGTDLYQLPNQSFTARWLATYVLKNADFVTADSQDLIQQAIKYGANPGISEVIQWGVDLKIFFPADKNPELQKRLKVGNHPVLLSPRAVKPIYNLETIIKAIPEVRRDLPETIFIFRDYNTDPNYKDRLLMLIDRLGVRESVRWFGELERWEECVEIYRLADIIISVPISDGTPVSVLESMACGIPVIASDLPSLREWIKNGENGILVPTRDEQVLADAIIKLLKDANKRADIRNRNIDLIRLRANPQIEMEKMETIYNFLQDRRQVNTRG